MLGVRGSLLVSRFLNLKKCVKLFSSSDVGSYDPNVLFGYANSYVSLSQWRRQDVKAVRSFRGQKILK